MDTNNPSQSLLQLPPEVAIGDWIQTTYRRWAKVEQVYERGLIECVYLTITGEAFSRDFKFHKGWWRFRYPDPDGGYLRERHDRIAKMLSEGPPSKIVGMSLEYLSTRGAVWQLPHNLPTVEA